jgi:ketosteroid isomerase-like protein
MATTTTDENIAIAQNGINDFLQGNIQGVLDACSDDIIWDSFHNPAVPFAKTYNGKDGVGQFFADLASNVDFTDFSPGKFYADDDCVFVKVHEAGTVKSTGKTYDNDFLMCFTINEGKITQFFAYVDSADQVRVFTP